MCWEGPSPDIGKKHNGGQVENGNLLPGKVRVFDKVRMLLDELA